MRQGQPKLTEEVEIRRNTNNTTGQPNVNVFKGVKLSMGQPKSNREVEVGEKVWRSSGQPSSPKDKNILVDQSIIRQPNSTKNMKLKNRRRR